MTLADDFNLRSRQLAKLTDFADAIDALRLPVYSFDEVGTISTTSSSQIKLGSATLTVPVGARQRVLLLGRVSLSGNTPGALVVPAIFRDSSQIDSHPPRMEVAHTSGCSTIDTFCLVDNPGVGSHDYEYYWNVTASSTGYCRDRRLLAIPFEYAS